MTAPDDGLFEELFLAARDDGLGPGHGVELYERRGCGLELTDDEQGIHVTETRERGFALRLYKGGRVAFAAAGPEGAAHLLPSARLLLPRARTRRGAKAATCAAGEVPQHAAAGEPSPPDETMVHTLLTTFRRALTAAGDRAVLVRDASVSVGERTERVATTGGRDASWSSRAATLVATVVGRAGSDRFAARVVAAAAAPEELPVARLAQHAADRVLLPLSGRGAPSGRLDVLMDSHVAAHLIGRVAPLFFGDRDDALLQARTRDGVDAFLSPVVSLVDDARAPGGPIRAPRDGEGTPAARTVVAQRGVPAAVLTDVGSAARREAPPTGNALRRSFTEAPRIGVTNFFVDPSAGVSPLDLLRAVDRGLYAAVLVEKPDVDLAADRFRLVVGGYAIEKGRASQRVGEAVMEGRLSQLLRGIAGIGDDLKFVAGAGGGVGSPTLFIPRWRL